MAQDNWPSQTIKLIVSYPPGGNTDAVARIAADFMQKALGGATVVVVNQAGAGGIVGTNAVATAKPDGYTLCMCAVGPITIAPAIEKLPYDPLKDLVPISLVSTNPLVLLVNPSVKASSTQQLVALARANPNGLNYSSAGVGSLTYFAAELFKYKTGTQITNVPYRGGTEATMAALAGNVQLTFANMSDALAQSKGSKLRALGVTTAKRSPAMPEVPTLAEQGIDGYSVESWNGLFAPKGTPRPIIERLAAIVAKMARDEAVQKRMAEFGSVAAADSSADFAHQLSEETSQWAGLVARTGAK
jgi:tripartite-type tricarboxylate transporter receptor subunit TctC